MKSFGNGFGGGAQTSTFAFFMAVFGLALASLALGLILITHGPSFPVEKDSLKYLAIRDSIANGSYAAIEGIIYPPGYPAFLAGLSALFGGSVETIYLVQFVLLGGIAIFTFLIANRHFGINYWLSLVLGLVMLAWPYMVLYSLLVMSEVLYSFLLLATIFTLLTALQSKNLVHFMFAGILLGLTTLVRPVALLLPFWLLGFAILGYYCYRMWRPSLLHIGIGLCFFVLTLAPWSVYLYSQTGSVLPVSSHLPAVLDKSYNTLSYDETFGDADAATPSLGDVMASKAQNLFLFWNPGAGGYQAESLTERFPLASILIIFYKIDFFLILLLGFLSLFLYTQNQHRALLMVLWGTILYTWLLHAALFPYPRYTLPIMPLVCILAGYTLMHHKLVRERVRHLFLKNFS